MVASTTTNLVIGILSAISIAGGVNAVLAAHSDNVRPSAARQAAPLRALQGNAIDRDRIRYAAGAQPKLTLPGGDTRTVESVLRIHRSMSFGEYVWNAADVPEGPVWVRVDLPRQLISVFRGGHEIGSAVILYGAEAKPTPAGRFPVLQKARDYHSRTYDAPMPFMLRLTADGVAIHGSHVRSGWATHGCIGVPEAFAKQLFAAMQVGDPVFIIA